MPPAAHTTANPSEATGWRRLVGDSPSGVWVFIDQGIVSLANFIAPVLVGRYAGQEELGFFALGFSLYFFALGLARAMVWTAYTRRSPQLPEADRPAYAGSATVHLALFATAACLAILAVAGGAWAIGATRYAGLLLVVAPCTAAMLLREHARRLDLARFDFFSVFGFDLAVAAVQVLLLAWLAATGRMSAEAAFLSLATASLLAIGWMTLRRETWTIDWSAVLPDWWENWSISKWLTGGAAAVLVGKEGYSWLLSVAYSIAELGRLGAGRILVQATNPLVIGGSNYLGPISARVLAEEGLTGLWRYTVRTTLGMLIAIGLFLLGVVAVGEELVCAVMKESAAGVTTLLLLTYSAGVLSEALLIPIEFASVNRGRGRLMFQTALVRLAVNVLIGFGLVGVFGAEAIGVGMLLGSLVALVWQWASFAQEVRHA